MPIASQNSLASRIWVAVRNASIKILRSMEWIAFTASSAIVLYAIFAVVAYALGTGVDEDCMNARAASEGNKGGILADAMARYCGVIGFPNEKRFGLHLSDGSGDSVLVYYESAQIRNTPVLRGLTTRI